MYNDVVAIQSTQPSSGNFELFKLDNITETLVEGFPGSPGRSSRYIDQPYNLSLNIEHSLYIGDKLIATFKILSSNEVSLVSKFTEGLTFWHSETTDDTYNIYDFVGISLKISTYYTSGEHKNRLNINFIGSMII